MTKPINMQAELVISGHARYLVVKVPSESNPEKFYRVNVTHQQCDCAAWKFQKGHKKPCKHLLSLGFEDTGLPAYKKPNITLPKPTPPTPDSVQIGGGKWLTAEEINNLL